MELFEALYTTRAMRRMQDRDVPEDVVRRVLDAAIRAPTAGNFQNWAFVVIRDRGTKERLQAIYLEQIVEARRTAYKELEEALARGERSERLDAHARMMRTVQYLGEHLADVPVMIAALLRTPDDALIHGGSIFPAIWSIQLAARAFGVGTVPVGSFAFRQDEVFDILGIPKDEHWQLGATVTLSYPAGRWGVPERRPVHEVTFSERWGQRPEWTVPEPLWPDGDGPGAT